MTESPKSEVPPETIPTPAPVSPKGRSPTERLQNAANRIQTMSPEEKEEELWEGGYSPQAMIGSWLLCAIVTAVLIVAKIAFAAQVPTMVLVGVIIAVWVIAMLVYAYRRLSIHYRLTTQRFIHQVGIFSRVTDRIEVIDIDDVTYSQGPVQRMFGVGTIRLTGSDRTHPQLVMVGIDHVREVSGLIDDIRRRERRRRSLHIEQI